MEELELRLEGIRTRANSKNQHEATLAVVLSSIEETLKNDNTEFTPTAYFVALLALLDQCFDGENDVLVGSAIYLIDVVAPYVPEGLLRSKVTPIVTTVTKALQDESTAPLLYRSCLGVLETTLIAQDFNSWTQMPSSTILERTLSYIMSFSLHSSPKVRRRANDALFKVLSTPPPSPSRDHPASLSISEQALSLLQTELSKRAKLNKSAKTGTDNSKLIHILQAIKSIATASAWSTKHVDVLCDMLMNICKTSDQYLVGVAFEVFQSLFKSSANEIDLDRLTRLLDSIFELQPSVNDQHLAPAWLAVVALAGEAFSAAAQVEAFQALPDMLNKVVKYLESDSPNVVTSAAECLVALISTVVPSNLLVEGKGSAPIIRNIADILFGLLHVKYQSARADVMKIFIAVFDVVKWKSNPDFINILKVCGALRADEMVGDEREALDGVIAAAIRALGPEVVLKHLPINILNATGSTQNLRLWILPLLRDNVKCTNLAHFANEMLPFSLKVQERAKKTSDQTQKKIFNTIYEQIWSTFPGYCFLPIDLQSTLTDEFAEVLVDTMYNNVDLRKTICQGLRVLVEQTSAHASGELSDDVLLAERYSSEDAQKDMELLKGFAQNMLKALFNVYHQTSVEQRDFFLRCIELYLQLLDEEAILGIFGNVSEMLSAALGESGDAEVRSTMMDLIICLIPFLPESQLPIVLNIFTSALPSEPRKSYRILTKLSEFPAGLAVLSDAMNEIQEQIMLADNTSASSRAARLTAIGNLVPYLQDLTVIPALLSEVVMATKDINEKSREAAFDLLVNFGKRMQKGGIIRNSAMNEDMEDTEASIEEYLRMVSAGLAGDTPHMISATISAIARIVYEFKDDVSQSVLKEITSTVELFLTTNNGEIARSAVGFAKISALCLPVEMVDLKALIAQLLTWSHEHKAHLKSKVKHIIERLVRRFGYDEVARNFPEEDMKLLTNIRKTRAKAKKSKKEGEEQIVHQSKSGSRFDNEFDAAVYGDSSDDSSSDDDEESEQQQQRQSKKSQRSSQYIHERGEDPMDLLDPSALSHIVSSKPKAVKRQLSGSNDKDAAGRIIVKDPSSENGGKPKSSIDAYVEAVKAGPVKGQRGKLKYKRGRKAQHSDDEGESDGENDILKKPVTQKRIMKKPFNKGAQKNKRRPLR